jgi:hypothetical protein
MNEMRKMTFCEFINFDELVKSPNPVTPAKAGVQNYLKLQRMFQYYQNA